MTPHKQLISISETRFSCYNSITIMKTYYDYFGLKINASKLQIEAAFQHYVSRYRVTADTEMIFNDETFKKKINAYLVLTSNYRLQYDAPIIKATAKGKKKIADIDIKLPDIDLYGQMSSLDRRIFMVNAAIWRRQMPSAMHILRGIIETHPKHAPVWALLGEVYLMTDRLDEGIKCYERAITADPENKDYYARLDHARLVLDGVVDLYIEPSPEEKLLVEERHARQKGMFAICAVAMFFLIYAFFPEMLKPISSYSLYIPWKSVSFQAIGLGIMAYGLGYGRILPSFEKLMIHATLPIFDRGSTNNYPYGMLLMITSTVCLWLGLVSVVIMSAFDEEWPIGPSVTVGVSIIFNLATVLYMYYTGENWLGTLAFGGNLAVMASLTGWWFGTLDMPSYT
jgi:tetratricopeptide (TPR) repeat protein